MAREQRLVEVGKGANGIPPMAKLMKSSSRDVVLSIRAHLEKVVVTMGELREQFEEANARIEKLEAICNELRDEMQGTLNKVIDTLVKRNVTIESTVEAMKKELNQHKDVFVVCRAVRVINLCGMVRVDEPKSRPFEGSRSAKEVDNFLWGMEQYFLSAGVAENAKASTASLYLTDVTVAMFPAGEERIAINKNTKE